ncbi:TPA: ABC transporter ATP-binding protein [Streptococcus suis]|jgi:branched-chain amino acid transport system ATP-binding protein|uniref:ABC transporter ATP-binding protein n=1 Tax=Streptococcus suis TaxID=1307 RepID=A0A9X4MJ36_STRSU|nr:ABC transporter ATP-binding protein [Streptococcus parasuis]MBP6171714.1 ABC transporter ATP-binding protein [Streptococcus sp.]MDG4498695.1 ABC transporter ATP-binding protein [Streptococcus suis]MBP7054950.1 ABC transporter ATP-binding protein [Streptococcus sp.]MBP8703710.1 ABC transporter ATP-binding protein [Streptococcus sp.]MCA9760603.1 ABC transporter ATP-binding protein [Streptococcus sp.]
MSMLKVENLSVHYGVIEAVKNVSFEVNEGEVVTLIGANGAGKTSILRTISGLVRPSSGTISFLGNEIQKVPARKIVADGLSQVPEGRHVFAGLTVMENLEMGAFLRNNREEYQANLKKIFARFPRLEERKNQDAATLSGGEQQMLAMGRALMSQPKLLLLDEPSMGLAPIFIQEIFDIIQDIQKQGTTVLLIEQNANKALAIADRGYVLETGKVALSGTGKELLASEEVKKAYLGG